MSVRTADDEDEEDDDCEDSTDEIDVADEFADDEGDLPTIDCPYCGWLIPEDAPRCPYCEKYISAEDAPPDRKPWWIIAGAVVCLYIVYRWIVG